MSSALIVLAALAALACLGYLAACAGAERWLLLGEWWGSRPVFHVSTPKQRDEVARRIYPMGMGHTAGEVAAAHAALTPRDRALLQQWEREHPRPAFPSSRDWARNPEDDYE